MRAVVCAAMLLVACKGKSDERRDDTVTAAPAPAPGKLEGTWRMEKSISISNFIEGEAGPPASPGTWTFTPDGRFEKRGGTELDGTYVQRDRTLTIRAQGVTLQYTIDALDAEALVVSQMIMEGTGTRTVLAREPTAPAP